MRKVYIRKIFNQITNLQFNEKNIEALKKNTPGELRLRHLPYLFYGGCYIYEANYNGVWCEIDELSWHLFYHLKNVHKERF